jgi:hypothetical protein
VNIRALGKLVPKLPWWVDLVPLTILGALASANPFFTSGSQGLEPAGIWGAARLLLVAWASYAAWRLGRRAGHAVRDPEVRKAVFGAWLVVSLVMGAAAAAPFFTPESAWHRLLGECPAKAAGGSCALCGMTAAYYYISRGDWAGAIQANRGAIPLYGFSLVNLTMALGSLVVRLRARNKQEVLACRS